MTSVPDAVRRSLRILATHRALFEKQRTHGWGLSMTEKDILRVVRIFEVEGARWALVGAHAIGLLTEPRATADFDFIVEERKLRVILRALEHEFGDLAARDEGAAIRLPAIDVDLIRSTNHPLFREAVDQVRTVGDWKIPRPEVIVALKFLSAVNPWRSRDKRGQDLVDLRVLVHALDPGELDRTYMMKLSSWVYPGAEREFADLLERIDRGDPIDL